MRRLLGVATAALSLIPLCIVALLVLLVYPFYATFDAACEMWRSDIRPAWRRARR